MRSRFNQQNSLDATPISEVKIDGKSRHELAPLLGSLQYIFTTPELNEKIFSLLESRIMDGKKQTGRWGMSLWEILVLGCVRLNLNTNYDALQDLANNHFMLRGILGIRTNEVFGEGHYYELSTLKENVGLLDEATLKAINLVIVKAGHSLLKKKEEVGAEKEEIKNRVKADTFSLAANVHFPTDMNLLWDGIRKSIDIVAKLLPKSEVKGWRKIMYIREKLRESYRDCSEIHRKKGHNYQERLRASVSAYLKRGENLSQKIKSSMEFFELPSQLSAQVELLVGQLKQFLLMLDKHIDLLDRRVMKGEQIPHEEKVFSIFEPHVEWLTKGKLHNGVVIGHNVLISTDQNHFILDHHVAERQVDKSLAIDLGTRLSENFSDGYFLESISFDRGFHSSLAKGNLGEIFKTVVMPKPGYKSSSVEQEESAEDYVQLRKKHSAVESNINELQHTGMDLVPDKGLDGFKDYVAFGVLAYNLRRLGKIVLEQKLLPTVIKPSNQQKPIAA